MHEQAAFCMLMWFTGLGPVVELAELTSSNRSCSPLEMVRFEKLQLECFFEGSYFLAVDLLNQVVCSDGFEVLLGHICRNVHSANQKAATRHVNC